MMKINNLNKKNKGLILVAYNGEQQGYTIRNYQLEQMFYKNLNLSISAIALGYNNDCFIAAENSLYHYTLTGKLIAHMEFPSVDICYTGLAITEDKVIASYTGSQMGCTIRDYSLRQTSCISTKFVPSEIALGAKNSLFIVSANHIYNYDLDGKLIKHMEFPSNDFFYTDVTTTEDKVIASYSGTQRGFSIRELSLNQTSYVETAFEVNAITVGIDNDLFLTSGNAIYRYSLNGKELGVSVYDDPHLRYTSVSCSKLEDIEDLYSLSNLKESAINTIFN